MKNYQRILVAIDIYSEYDEVLKRALAVVENASQLSVVFVTMPTTYFQPYIGGVGGAIMQVCLSPACCKHHHRFSRRSAPCSRRSSMARAGG